MQFIHTLHYMLHYCMIVYFPFLFSNVSFWPTQTVYTAYEHRISLEYYFSLEYDILAHVARIFNKYMYTPGIYGILLEFQHIT